MVDKMYMYMNILFNGKLYRQHLFYVFEYYFKQFIVMEW